MKVKHLKTKTTIELTPEELHDWISRVNTLENITDNICEIFFKKPIGNRNI